ncbi:MAG TPA: hypothetical protein VMW17_09970 [Candidatus Binatia bacterium]|nr:hypothetical protein [Candidatus Binatia bacterium]
MAPVAAVLGILLAVAGCASMQRVGGWFGGTPTPAPTATPPPRAAGGRAYFAGVEGMKVYSEPSLSSKLVGELSLHEKVTRFKIERGFAYVESATSELKGWVNNAQLIWRLPGPTPAAPAAGEAEAPEIPATEKAPPVETTEAPATFVQPTATPTNTVAAVAPSSPTATPRGAAPSIFDAY